MKTAGKTFSVASSNGLGKRKGKPSIVPSLILISGSDYPFRVTLNEASITIGRDETVEVCLPDLQVSNRHASIHCEKGTYLLHDLDSSNGTYVNGQRIHQCKLKNRDVIEIGPYQFRVSLPEQRVFPRFVQTAPLPSPTNVIPFPRVLPAAPPVSYLFCEKQTNYAYLAFLCGWLGFIAFIPAIIFGHLALETNSEDRFHRWFGMISGYLFLAIWLMLFLFYFDQRSRANVFF